MNNLETDLNQLEEALRLLFQTLKRPQHWATVSSLAGVDIDRPSAVILHSLIANGAPCRVHDLAVQLGIEAPSVTRTTQTLEQAGYLRRTRDSADRRAIGLEVTSKGRRVAAKLRTVQREALSQVLTSWPESERHSFVTLFERYSRDITAYYQLSVPGPNERKH